jgi:hypothetical protein
MSFAGPSVELYFQTVAGWGVNGNRETSIDTDGLVRVTGFETDQITCGIQGTDDIMVNVPQGWAERLAEFYDTQMIPYTSPPRFRGNCHLFARFMLELPVDTVEARFPICRDLTPAGDQLSPGQYLAIGSFRKGAPVRPAHSRGRHTPYNHNNILHSAIALGEGADDQIIQVAGYSGTLAIGTRDAVLEHYSADKPPEVDLSWVTLSPQSIHNQTYL